MDGAGFFSITTRTRSGNDDVKGAKGTNAVRDGLQGLLDSQCDCALDEWYSEITN